MRRAVPLLLALALTLAACAPRSRSDTVFAMDTVMELSIYGGADTLDSAKALITELDASLSPTAPDSEIYELNLTGSADLDQGTAELVRRALEICALTGGALDITVRPAMLAWGFTTGEYRVPQKAELNALKKKVDYTAVELSANTVTLPEGFMLDLGAVAKGWTGDRLTELLRDEGVTSALLNLGGNVHALGAKPDGSPWRVGIRDPFGDSCLAAVEVADMAVVTSGGYERYFEQAGQVYWHILDPATCSPARSGLASVTVIGPEGVLCDGLSTALFVMGLQAARDLWRDNEGFDCVFVTEDGEVYITEGIENNITLAGDYVNTDLQVIRRG